MGANLYFPASIPDGTSNTLMIGECMIQVHDHLQNVGWWHFNVGTAHSTTNIPINYETPEKINKGPCEQIQNNWSTVWGFGSRHTGGTNFSFADGSIHFISQTIDMRVYQRLGCRNDGKVVGVYE
jgi:prepilin-type processing-associated H-X9-DG protein